MFNKRSNETKTSLAVHFFLHQCLRAKVLAPHPLNSSAALEREQHVPTLLTHLDFYHSINNIYIYLKEKKNQTINSLW